jgi:hypothetical protein
VARSVTVDWMRGLSLKEEEDLCRPSSHLSPYKLGVHLGIYLRRTFIRNPDIPELKKLALNHFDFFRGQGFDKL